jgi:hypothetical protein
MDAPVYWITGEVDGVAFSRFDQQQPGGAEAAETKFTRALKVQPLCRASGATGPSFDYDVSAGSCLAGQVLIGVQVSAKVTWPQGLGRVQVVLQTRLFDWR